MKSYWETKYDQLSERVEILEDTIVRLNVLTAILAKDITEDELVGLNEQIKIYENQKCDETMRFTTNMIVPKDAPKTKWWPFKI